jgi:hypothetical protein
MAGHEADWVQQPAFGSRSVGQYYCSRCGLELDVWYNENRVAEFCTGWIWRIRDRSGQNIEEAGNKYTASMIRTALPLTMSKKKRCGGLILYLVGD